MINQPDNKFMLDLLPHKPPFRFVDGIITYTPKSGIQTFFCPEQSSDYLGKGIHIPPVILIEGLAQSAVLYSILESEPLDENEFPLLGYVNAKIARNVMWSEKIYYSVSTLRMLKKRAVLHGQMFNNNEELLIDTSISVSVAKKEGGFSNVIRILE
ncbi:MAG: hypothetical protein ACQEXX_25070 [Bacillota bacterium]